MASPLVAGEAGLEHASITTYIGLLGSIACNKSTLAGFVATSARPWAEIEAYFTAHDQTHQESFKQTKSMAVHKRQLVCLVLLFYTLAFTVTTLSMWAL